MTTKKYSGSMSAIDPGKEYTLKEVRDLRLIPWAKHYQTLRRIVSGDFLGDNVLKAVRRGEGRLIRYSIKGSNIIRYVEINGYAKKRSGAGEH